MDDIPTCHPARILISSSRKPISYINLAKRFLQEHGELQLSALGIAIAPMVTVAEILKNRGLAVEKKLITSLESLADDYRTRQKPKMEITLTKSPQFDKIIEEESDGILPLEDGHAEEDGNVTGVQEDGFISREEGVSMGDGLPDGGS